ncbi:phosphonoformate cytidylyltransferase [Pseudonocardia ammonioxydans]|uniref:Phosphonoformate cytidylyltransferase n=1 Tax=Pseudonocardia ammonioxydans TaxID=260086 RepID=A0A1I5E463_PSUAM|nr:phosphonoformate cytidylyltransferase [Pseudonocardia ammonioxydans]
MRHLACVTGRFQPVHEQHLELFELALREAEHLVVAVTNPDTRARHEETTSEHRHLAEANPFTYYERLRLLEAALAERGLSNRTAIVPFDLTRPETWHEYVPGHALQWVRAYSAWERQKAGRLADAGYEVTVLDGDPATRLSASDIRAHLDADRAVWARLVPPAVAPVLSELLADRNRTDAEEAP